MTETSRLVEQIDAKNRRISELMAAARPATDTLAANTTQIADLVQQVGDVGAQLQKFPSIAGTDTSGRSVIGDANSIAAAWNDVVLAPDATLARPQPPDAAVRQIDCQQRHLGPGEHRPVGARVDSRHRVRR